MDQRPGDQQDQRGGGQEALGAAGIEARQRDPAAPLDSRTSMPVMRNPEMTKKTSTPTKPARTSETPPW